MLLCRRCGGCLHGGSPQHPLPDVHLAFCAFCADLVTLPLVAVFFSTHLITPTATVWRMSRTANLPEQGWGNRRDELEIWIFGGFFCSIIENCSLKQAFRSKLTQWWVIGEALHTHGFSRVHVHDGSVSTLEELGIVFKLLPWATVNLLLKLRKLASDVRSVAIQHWGITSPDLTRVV